MAKKPKLGSGARFKTLVQDIATQGDVRDPAAVAASIGRKKYGATRMANLAVKGKRKTIAAGG